MAVEEDGGGGVQEAQERQASRELVDDEGTGAKSGQLLGEGDVEDELDVAEDGAEDGEAGEEGGRDGRGGAYADVEGSWSGEKRHVSSRPSGGARGRKGSWQGAPPGPYRRDTRRSNGRHRSGW